MNWGRVGLAIVVLTIGFLLPARADANPLLDWWTKKKDCPRPSYTPFHYATPQLYRVKAFVDHYPRAPLHAVDRYPSLPSPQHVIGFHCPAADPASLYGHAPIGY